MPAVVCAALMDWSNVPKSLDPHDKSRGFGNIAIEAAFDSSQKLSAPLLYQIRRTDGAGLMSTIGSVLTQIGIAEWLGAEPVVDLRQGSAYQEELPVHGTRNVWEYYFEPVGDWGTTDIDSGEYRVLRSEEHHPIVHRDNKEETLRSLWQTYARYTDITSRAISEVTSHLSISMDTIGVHIRSGDMRSYPGHPLPPTLKQLVATTKAFLDSSNFDSVFVAAQEVSAVQHMRKAFGSRLVESPSFKVGSRESRAVTPFSSGRTHSRKPSSQDARPHHRYLLGLEVLQDVTLLSSCGTLVSGISNVSQWATILTSGFREDPVVIDNGVNSSNRFMASITWPIRSILPAQWGGFPR